MQKRSKKKHPEEREADVGVLQRGDSRIMCYFDSINERCVASGVAS